MTDATKGGVRFLRWQRKRERHRGVVAFVHRQLPILWHLTRRPYSDKTDYGIIMPQSAEKINRILAMGDRYRTRGMPQKNRATVPGPVWLPMVVPMLLMSTLPLSLGNRSSTRRATSRASSSQADMEMKHLPS